MQKKKFVCECSQKKTIGILFLFIGIVAIGGLVVQHSLTESFEERLYQEGVTCRDVTHDMVQWYQLQPNETIAVSKEFQMINLTVHCSSQITTGNSRLYNYEDVSGACVYIFKATQCLKNWETWDLDFNEEAEELKYNLELCRNKYRCPDYYIGDGECDSRCNNPECNFDGGDCAPRETCGHLVCYVDDIGNEVCDSACNIAECNFDGGDCD